jgi:DNA-binding response OmpR family regulator
MKILAVEDDRLIGSMIKSGLGRESHIVEIAEDGVAGSFMSRSYDYDVIILDQTLPKKSGLDLCREIRATGKTVPIIFLSVLTDTETKICALECGADDYMTKPFSMNELNARLKAITRRPSQIKKENILTIADVVLNQDKQTVTRGGKLIPLTRKEFGVLEYLMKNPGAILSRTAIMERVWTAEADPFSNTVETHILNIRKKLKTKNKPDLISNIQGRGYMISES